MQPYLPHAGEQINKEKTANMQQKPKLLLPQQTSPFPCCKKGHFIKYKKSFGSRFTWSHLYELKEQKSDSPKPALPLGPVFHIQLENNHQLKSLPTPLPSNSTIDINKHSANCTLIQPYTFSSHRLHFIPNAGMSTLTVSYKIC